MADLRAFGQIGGQAVSVRVMRSIGERRDDRFGKYEVTVGKKKSVVDHLDDIQGLRALLRADAEILKSVILKIFLEPRS